MSETVEKKLLSELLEETELNADVLEKIGFAGRAFYVFRSFDVVPFGDCEYEDYFCLACLTASLSSRGSQMEIESGCDMIALCLELSLGIQEKQAVRKDGTRKEGVLCDT